MLIRNGSIVGADLLFTDKSDCLRGVKTLEFCALSFAYPKVMLVGCSVYMPMGALNVTVQEDAMSNSQNRSLRLVDPACPGGTGDDVADRHIAAWMAERGVEVGNPDDSWVFLMGLTLDRCYLPVFTFARQTEIVYDAPPKDAPISRQQKRALERHAVARR